jgi:hypothetical protein
MARSVRTLAMLALPERPEVPLGAHVDRVLRDGWRRRDALAQIIARQHIERVGGAEHHDRARVAGEPGSERSASS